MTPEATPAGRSRRWAVFAFPAAVSLALSAASVGSHPYWQDSSFYLIAVREFSVLYPPGFMLYLLLCKGWTLLVGGFLDFTLAVHLFSSLCAAAAAGTLALAAARASADARSGAVAGALAAAGYTWWFSGIYAKGYALYFLLVAVLLWRLASGDRYRILPLLGLAWAAHPSAALLGPGVLFYLWGRRRDLERGKLALSAAIGAAAAGGWSLLVPLLAARGSIDSMAHPTTPGELLRYLTATKFASLRGVWGWSAHRWTDLVKFAAEEFLLVGGGLAAWGVRELWRSRRRELAFLAIWSGPILVLLPLFKIEGQSDFWLVAVWMPLWMAAAVGLSALRARSRAWPAAALAAGLACAVAANGRDLALRHETRPEMLGRSFLEHLERGATLVVNSDDAMGLCRYLQLVRGFRPDVRLVVLSYVQPSSRQAWYLDGLCRAWPEFPRPDFRRLAPFAARYSDLALSQAAILSGRRPGGPPVYFDREPAAALFPSGSAVPSGFLWKWSDRAATAPDPDAWSFPISAEEVAQRPGRRRAQRVALGPGGLEVAPEAYEERLVAWLLQARRYRAALLQGLSTPPAFLESARLYESILRLAPDAADDPEVTYPLALDYFMLDRYPEAEALFGRLAAGDPGPARKAGTLFYLGELRRMARRPEEARTFYRQALEASPPGSPLRGPLEERLSPRPR